ncbi:hypothetical protein EDD86DRAFT_202641 [Gorgonomyces haynaldii]|nr:hypothetical protein EDD86DRAFT_202641 [Gorgonomyces haynaldii]
MLTAASAGQPKVVLSTPNKDIYHRFGVDILAAVGSATLASPLISIVDKAIFSNASGKESMGTALKNGFITLVTRPIYFFRQPSCFLIIGVYSGTYIAANFTQTWCDHYNKPWQFPKFIASSIANVGLSVAKDRYFTRAFGKGDVKPVPALSYSLYTVRDSMSVYASFVLPPVVGAKMMEYGFSQKSSDVLSQLITPCAVQFLSSPLHLFGMNYYNVPVATTAERVAFIRKEYFKTTGARIARIFPAFGIAGVVNKQIRSSL